MLAHKTVSVNLDARRYPIVIGRGLIDHASHHLTTHLPQVSKYAVVADRSVLDFAQRLEVSLRESDRLLGSMCMVPSGEQSKNFKMLETVVDHLLDSGIERGHAVIALGGGVVGDLVGFAAAIVKRGVRLVQVPTTLLAQVDSSVGGKTGINTRHGKNLVGAFHQPSLVLADLDTLITLPKREFRAGYAEVAKYGALGDATFFNWLEQNQDDIFDLREDALVKSVQTSCQMKADIVVRDEFEMGERALLNLGHTFGHALEAWAGYDGRLLHGEAVAFGMVLAAQFSAILGHCKSTVAVRLEHHLSKCGFYTDFSTLRSKVGAIPSADVLLRFMQQDKKARHGKMIFILLREIGDAFVASDISQDVVHNFLEKVITHPTR